MKTIPLLAATIISFGLTSVVQAQGKEIPEYKGTKQLMEGPYSNNLDAASYFQVGVKLYGRRDFPGAERAFRKALEFDPYTAMGRYLLANTYLQQGKNQLALEQYQIAIALDPTLSQAYYNLGIAFYKEGAPDSAIAAYRQALSFNPESANIYYN